MELNRKERKIISTLLNNADSLFEDMIEEIGSEYDYGFRIQDVRDLFQRFDTVDLPDEEWKKYIRYEKEALDEV
jgi:hypothetical protein